MKFVSALVNKLSPKRDPAILYVIIDELPNTDAIEALIGQYWQEIQSSGYQRFQYKNVSDWVQKKIEAKLASGRR